MSTIVLKFGGTSVATTDLIESAANIVKSEYDKGNNIVVVVSAMSGATNQLIEHVDKINYNDDSEYDVVVSSGEQVTAGLMSLALKKIGLPSRSWLGWQVPIITRGSHRNSFIDKVIPDKIINDFENKKIAVVAGFQGISNEGRITTIGRGGSDNTAVFIASAIKAERCDIYTDVDGVYTSDPRMTENVRRLDKISYEEMIEMASQGAKVLQTASVESAMSNDVDVYVRSTFSPSDKGTLISNDVNNENDRAVTGVAYSKDEAKITLIDVEDKPGVAAEIFNKLAENSVNVDMIVQNNFIERKILRKQGVKTGNLIDFNLIFDTNFLKTLNYIMSSFTKEKASPFLSEIFGKTNIYRVFFGGQVRTLVGRCFFLISEKLIPNSHLNSFIFSL